MAFMEDSLDWSMAKVLPLMQKRIMEQTTYHGIPTLKHPLDFWVYQEIIWDTRPDVIIEIGNLYGGSTLALAHFCDTLGKGTIIGVDSNQQNVRPEVKAHQRIKLVEGDACEVLSVVQRSISSDQQIMIIE